MATKVKLSNKKGPIEYPKDHQPGMKVAHGGSCCANCFFWDGEDCENTYYRKWNNGSGEIPEKPDDYCSDWWMPRKKEKEK